MISRQKTIKGTVVKMLVGFEYPADPTVTLDEINWHTEWFCGAYNARRCFRLEKSQHSREVEGRGTELEKVNYYAYVDTGVTGAGILSMRLWADIPDFTQEGGVRPEYAEISTGETIY